MGLKNTDYFRFFCLVFVFIFMPSCKGSLEETESQKIKLANRIESDIKRRAHQRLVCVEITENTTRNAYPWERKYRSKFSPITKEFFRCKGSSERDSYLIGEERIFDCNGFERHSLPLKDGKEFVYPVLIEILNFIQSELNSKLVITCGHRCPQHNRFSDPAEFNRTSKHMIAAEVDFYVEGYEHDPIKVLQEIFNYYQQSQYAGRKNYQEFRRYSKSDINVSTPPWFNQEIFVKLYKKNEGRDLDNDHNLPYLSIQVRYDPLEKQRVTYTWQGAFYNYLRY